MLSGTWQEIPDFPGFLISNDGRVWSHRSNRELSLSHNSAGLIKVNLVRDGINHSRLVKILVAEAYVEIPRWAHQEVFSHPELDRDVTVGVANPRTLTPINKDGDQTNNHWLNLVWRPRWYAWKYTRQFSYDIDRPEYHVPVFNATTEIIYETIIDAGIADGMLWSDIVIAAVEERPRFPEHMLYSFI